jgi:hypothetical protein
LPLYRPRDPRATDLWRLIDQHFETFRQVYNERFQAKYGFWRPVVDRSVSVFLKCGDLGRAYALAALSARDTALSQFRYLPDGNQISYH